MNYIEENMRSRERLGTLVSSLSMDEYALPVGAGWTISALLAHLAFWDLRVWQLIQRWKREGVGRSPVDFDNINDAMQPLCLAIPGPEAGRLALQAAEAVDAELANLPEQILPGIQALVREGKFRMFRSLHRNDHLDQMEKVLAEHRRSEF